MERTCTAAAVAPTTNPAIRNAGGWPIKLRYTRHTASIPTSVRVSARFSTRSPSGAISSRPAPYPASGEVTSNPLAPGAKPSAAPISPVSGWA